MEEFQVNNTGKYIANLRLCAGIVLLSIIDLFQHLWYDMSEKRLLLQLRGYIIQRIKY